MRSTISRAFFIALAAVCSAIPMRRLVARDVTSADITTLSELFKRIYDPMIAEQQNLIAKTWNEFSDGDDELGGEGWFFENKMGGNQEGIGARGERGTLPSAGHQRWKQGVITEKYIYATFELTGPVIERAKTRLRAFASARTDEMRSLTKDLLKDMNRMFYGDGTGKLAAATGASGGSSGAYTIPIDSWLYVRVNMLIDVWDASNPDTANVTAGKITAITPATDGTATITIDSTSITAVAAGDVVIRNAAAEDDGAGDRTAHEMTGIQQIVDDGTIAATFENISRSAYPLFKGHVLDNGGTDRSLSEDLIQRTRDLVERASGGPPDWCRSNTGQRRKYFDLVKPDKRYSGLSLDGGYQRLEYNGLEITIDIDCPFGMMLFLRKDSIKKYILRRLGILDQDGLTIRKKSGQDVWEGVIGTYMNLGSKMPNHNAILKDLEEPEVDPWTW